MTDSAPQDHDAEHAAEYEAWQKRWEAEKLANEAREKKLISLFPELLRLLATKDKSEPIGWNGIETPNAWEDTIVIPMFTEMNNVLRPLNLPAESWPAVQQLKSKFASLRCYMGRGKVEDEIWKKISEIVSKYEAISAVTSEVSGKPGELFNSGGWWSILTPEEIIQSVVNQVEHAQKEWKENKEFAPAAVVHYKTKKGVQCVAALHDDKLVPAWQNKETQDANEVELIQIWIKPTKAEKPQG